MSDLVESTESKLLLFARPSRLLLLTGLSLAFVAAGVWLGIAHAELAANVTGWVAVAFFGACGIFIGRRLVIRTPVLVIDRDGILDRASAIAVGRVAWDEIADIVISQVGGQKFLGIHVHDVAGLRERLPRGKRLMLRMNAVFGFAPVNLPQSVLPMPVEELASSMIGTLEGRAASEPLADE